MTTFDGLVLAGGHGRRLGNRRKPQLAIGDRTMVETVVAALRGATTVVVVGEGYDVVEDPPLGGPVAAITAGLARISSSITVVLAADLPFVTAEVVSQLVAAAPAVCVDDADRPQYLLGAYLTEPLRRALPKNPTGVPMYRVFEALDVAPIKLTQTPPPWWDCDTPEQLAQARQWHRDGGTEGRIPD